MHIGYVRVSKADGTQDHTLQLDAMKAAGVTAKNIYEDRITGSRDDRPGLEACLKALREGDILVVWKLDRLGRSMQHLVNTVEDLAARGVGFKVLTGQGASIDTTTAAGKFFFGVFASLAEFERALIRERTMAGLASARARGRSGGRAPAMSKSKVRRAQAAMQHTDTDVGELARELGVSRSTLYRYVSPDGQLRDRGRAILGVTATS